MSTETIQAGNKLIAEFMGWKRSTYPNLPNKMYKGEREEEIGLHIDEFKYHSSWDWLMPVVQKIEWMDSDKIDSRITIERQECKIYFDSEAGKYEWMIGGSPKIESVWKSIVRFITWYNSTTELSKPLKP